MKSLSDTSAEKTRWHPVTKLLVVAALVAVPYLFWTRPDQTPGAAAPPRPAEAEPAAAAGPDPAPEAALEPYALPPLERFAAVVERPLFSPTRRMPPLSEPEPEPSTEVAAEVPPPVQGPDEPELRFFGTVRQAGQATALVTFPETNEVARLAPGDQVGEWEVLEVERNRLVLGLGEDRRSFEIFGAGLRLPAEPAPAAEAPPIPSEEPPPEDETGYPPDEPLPPG